jgi:hypothetical protein
MVDETKFKVLVSGNGVSIDREVDAELARSIINILMGGPHVPPAGSSGPKAPLNRQEHIPNHVTNERRMSLREYLDDAQAVRNPDKITAIAEYLSAEGTEVTRDSVKSRFRAAGEAAPGNYPRDFAWAIKSGWIAEDPDRAGEYYVTQKGKKAIESKFSDEIKKATAQGASRRRKRSSGSRDENSGDEE